MPYTEALSASISLALIVIFYILWRDYWIDEVRDDLFALRDEMFSYAYTCGIVDDDAHRLLRATMNSVIRYAHEISPVRFLLLAAANALWKQPLPDALIKWGEAMDRLPENHRAKLSEFHSRMVLLLGRQLFKTSLFFRFVAYVVGLVLWFLRGNSDGRKELAGKMPLALFEQDALTTGHA